MEGLVPTAALTQLVSFVSLPLAIGMVLAGLAVASGLAGRLALWCEDRVAVCRFRRSERSIAERAR